MNDMKSANSDVNVLLVNTRIIAVEILSDLYSSNKLSIEAFEKVVALVEKSESVIEIRNIFSNNGIDQNKLILETYSEIPQIGKISTIGSRKTIDNERLITREIKVEIAHTKVILDYSSIDLPEGQYILDFDCRHSKCEILLPDDIVIENELDELFSKTLDKRKKNDIRSNKKIKLLGRLRYSKIIIKKTSKRK